MVNFSQNKQVLLIGVVVIMSCLIGLNIFEFVFREFLRGLEMSIGNLYRYIQYLFMGTPVSYEPVEWFFTVDLLSDILSIGLIIVVFSFVGFLFSSLFLYGKNVTSKGLRNLIFSSVFLGVVGSLIQLVSDVFLSDALISYRDLSGFIFIVTCMCYSYRFVKTISRHHLQLS